LTDVPVGDSARVDMKWKAYGRYGSVGFELVVSMAVGYFFGKWLDGKFQTGNWMTGIFSVVGVYAGFRSLFKAANQMQVDIEKEEKLGRGENPWKVPMPEGYEDGEVPEAEAGSDAETEDETLESPRERRERELEQERENERERRARERELARELERTSQDEASPESEKKP
jgi:F0F1-type ATP synthase assembly protein I